MWGSGMKKVVTIIFDLAIYAADVHSDGDREAKRNRIGRKFYFWALMVPQAQQGGNCVMKIKMFCSDDRASLGWHCLQLKIQKRA